MVGVQSADDLDRAFSTMISGRAEALLVFPSPMLFLHRQRVVELANSHRLPVMTGSREFANLGALMAYGASQSDLVRRGATYVDKILKGAKPAELPIEQPTKFELVINLKTAKALGLTLPPTLLALADEVIE
jgi:putative ABC transport system substrate-binding protein